MPEMYFRVCWPDGEVQRCYSPSTVVGEFFRPGTAYPLDEFVERSRRALGIAGDRVRAIYGVPCGAAAGNWRRSSRPPPGTPPRRTPG